MSELYTKIIKRLKGAYGLKLAAISLALPGIFLIVEHYVMWGGFNDTFGHEHVGIILIITSIITYILSKIETKKELQEANI